MDDDDDDDDDEICMLQSMRGMVGVGFRRHLDRA